MERRFESNPNDEAKKESPSSSDYLLVRTVSGCYEEITGFRRLTQQLYERIISLESEKAKHHLTVQLLCKRIVELETQVAQSDVSGRKTISTLTESEKALLQEIMQAAGTTSGDTREILQLTKSLDAALSDSIRLPPGLVGQRNDIAAAFVDNFQNKVLGTAHKGKTQSKSAKDVASALSESHITRTVKTHATRKSSATSRDRGKASSKNPSVVLHGDAKEGSAEVVEKGLPLKKRSSMSARARLCTAPVDAPTAANAGVAQKKRKAKKKKATKAIGEIGHHDTQHPGTGREKAVSPVASVHRKSETNQAGKSSVNVAGSRPSSASRKHGRKSDDGNRSRRDLSVKKRTKQPSEIKASTDKKKGRKGRAEHRKQTVRARSSSTKTSHGKEKGPHKSTRAGETARRQPSDKNLSVAKLLKTPPTFSKLGMKKNMDPRVAVKIKGFKFRALTADEKRELEKKAQELLERREEEGSDYSSYSDDSDSFTDSSDYDSDGSFTDESSD